MQDVFSHVTFDIYFSAALLFPSVFHCILVREINQQQGNVFVAKFIWEIRCVYHHPVLENHQCTVAHERL